MKQVYFTLPTPPSTNALFRNVAGRGRVKTKLYKDFIAYGLSAIRQQRVEPVKGRVVMVMGIERANMRADIDNHVKALLDVIVKAGVLEDDRYVTGFAASWLPPAEGVAHVMIAPVAPLILAFEPAGDGVYGGFTEKFNKLETGE